MNFFCLWNILFSELVLVLLIGSDLSSHCTKNGVILKEIMMICSDLLKKLLQENFIFVAAPHIDINPCTESAISFFLINWNMKLELKFWFSFLYWSWDRKHQNKWFSDFQNSWTLKFKFEVCFSFFILIWKTKNQIYLNKYLMKLVTIPLTQS